MAVRTKIPYNSGLFFVTFTCANWLPLFEVTNGYELVYDFFNSLKRNGHFVNAYVIMPNHVHALLTFTYTDKSINRIIGDGKRFISYGLVKKLTKMGRADMLNRLSEFVNYTDRQRGKRHEVFEPSFDWKECYSDDFIDQKMNYIHMNPCVCNPPLAKNPTDYLHSSANFYLGGEKIVYEVEHVMKDINFDKK